MITYHRLFCTLWVNPIVFVEFQKQAEVLLNADDLDTMWVLLRENCSVDEASGTEKVRFVYRLASVAPPVSKILLMFVSFLSYVRSLLSLLIEFNNLIEFGVQMNYEDFCHIATLCTEQIGPKCRKFFSACNFLKFEKDDFGRIAILPFYLYVMRTVSL